MDDIRPCAMAVKSTNRYSCIIILNYIFYHGNSAFQSKFIARSLVFRASLMRLPSRARFCLKPNLFGSKRLSTTKLPTKLPCSNFAPLGQRTGPQRHLVAGERIVTMKVTQATATPSLGACEKTMWWRLVQNDRRELCRSLFYLEPHLNQLSIT